MFIVFDGNDGSGKETQTNLLMEALEVRDIRSKKFAFPQYKESLGGKLLAECLAGRRGDFVNLDTQLASLPYAIDRFEASAEILKALADNAVVVADRYTSSNQIHQGGKLIEEEREDFLEWLHTLEHVKLGNPQPDIVIYLRVPVEISLELLAKKRPSKSGVLGDGALDQVESDRTYLNNSLAMADWLAARNDNWHIIDCMGDDGALLSIEEIHWKVCDIVFPMLDITE